MESSRALARGQGAARLSPDLSAFPARPELTVSPEFRVAASAFLLALRVQAAFRRLFVVTGNPSDVVSMGTVARSVAAELGHPSAPLQSWSLLGAIARALEGEGLTSKRTRRRASGQPIAKRTWVGVAPRPAVAPDIHGRRVGQSSEENGVAESAL